MKVYIVTDLEGVAGVCLFNQTRPPDLVEAENLRARRLLTGEVSAAAEGCFLGGATQVVVNDGHGPGNSILVDEMHPDIELIHGRDRPQMLVGCDETFDAVMLVGQHAMQSAKTGVLHHTQSSKTWAGYWINGREHGEIGQIAIHAGVLGLPVICVTGDTAACDEARDFLGDRVVTAAVKHGYSRHCERTLSPQRARELIRDACREAMGRLGEVPVYRIDLPAHIKLELQTVTLADGYRPRQARRTGPCTFEMTIDDPLQILKF